MWTFDETTRYFVEMALKGASMCVPKLNINWNAEVLLWAITKVDAFDRHFTIAETLHLTPPHMIRNLLRCRLHISDVWAMNGCLDYISNSSKFYIRMIPRRANFAAIMGHKHVLEWFWKSDQGWEYGIAINAALGGHIDLLRWLKEHSCVVKDEMMTLAAAVSGNMDEMQRFIEENKPFHDRCLPMAISKGHLQMAKFLYEKGAKNDGIVDIAASTGNQSVFEWAAGVQKGTPSTCAAAAEAGHLHILKMARKLGCPWNEATCFSAARGGHLDILQWARNNNCPWNAATCSTAARGGHLHILKWARAHGCPWDADTCNSAAENGHLDVIKWARSLGCDWHSDMYCYAASGGHLHVIKWIYQNDCPWDKDTPSLAAMYGQRQVLEWVLEKDIRFSIWLCAFHACCNGYDLVHDWLRRMPMNQV